MTEGLIAPADRLTLTGRSGSSRKLLQRKAAEKAAEKAASGPAADALEDAFPAGADETVPPLGQASAEPSVGPLQSSPGAAPAAPTQVPAQAPAWSSEDEAALQGLLARRKAAGYQRRGRDVSGQRLRLGDIKPNAGTVAATIVGLVAERGELDRAELIDAMASATFLHPKAQPQEKGWCQGYVAGAIRSGFLVVAGEASAQSAEIPEMPRGEPSTTPAQEG